MPAAPSTPPPAVGTVIDNGSLELTEILGYGGYGVVYRARDLVAARSGVRAEYAIKCLAHAQAQRQRALHLREVTLHRLASAHPGVVGLHRIIDEGAHTFLVMDYCRDGDLFSQILHRRTYLGNDRLIAHVFLQLLDAVDHCHGLGIYHRDLKPENVLCYDEGIRVAITDFGLATTDKMSQEFRTGSVYHMSPECQGGRFAPTGSYSPMFNDIWSLGIILLNLATGRNPWKSATLSDPTFYAYLQDPAHFLPTVLPISDELNALLVRVLEPDYRKRATLRELRAGVRQLSGLYAPDVVFEHAMARCAWEASAEEDSASESSGAQDVQTPEPEPVVVVAPAPATVTPVVIEEEVVVVKKEKKPVVRVAVQVSASWAVDDEPMAYASPTDSASWFDFSESPVEAGPESDIYGEDDDAEVTTKTAIQFVREPSDASDVSDASVRPSSFVEPLEATSTWSAYSEWFDADGDRSMSPSPSPTAAAFASSRAWSAASSSYSTPSTPRSSASLPPTPRVNAGTLPALSIDTASIVVVADPYDGDSSMLSAGSSALATAVEGWNDGESAPPAPWSDLFVLPAGGADPAKGAAHHHLRGASPMALDDVTFESHHPYRATPTPAAVAGPRRRAFVREPSSAAGSVGHDADVEDAAPHFSSPAALNALARRAFAVRRPSDTTTASSSSNSSSNATSVEQQSSAAGGKARPAHQRRGSDRFKPFRLALRSLSPSAARSKRAAAAAMASATTPPQSAPATTTSFPASSKRAFRAAAARSSSSSSSSGAGAAASVAWPAPAGKFVFGAGAHVPFKPFAAVAAAAAAREEAERGRGLKLRSAAKKSWFLPRRVLASTA